MSIPKDSSKQRNIVKKYNYYNLINGYKKPFLEDINNYPKFADKNEDFFIKGTTPEQLEALLGFDEKLRMIFLKRILKIEEKLKDVLVQSFYE
ncbi:TPA: Abi family protein, partial [Staphylococcus pseudintermedius]|nr:Abi family protein [Staphylococcus pseudintermedius]